MISVIAVAVTANQKPKVTLSDLLSPRDLEILAWYFADGRTLADIGSLLRVRKQTIHERIQRCLKVLARNGIPLPVRPPTIKLKERVFDPQILDAVKWGNDDNEDDNY